MKEFKQILDDHGFQWYTNGNGNLIAIEVGTWWGNPYEEHTDVSGFTRVELYRWLGY